MYCLRRYVSHTAYIYGCMEERYALVYIRVLDMPIFLSLCIWADIVIYMSTHVWMHTCSLNYMLGRWLLPRNNISVWPCPPGKWGFIGYVLEIKEGKG